MKTSVKITMFLMLLFASRTLADMNIFLSGDGNIANALTGLAPTSFIDTGNQQFFSNILGTGTNVALLDNIYNGGSESQTTSYMITDIDSYYNTLSGVTSSIFSGDVTSSQLSGVDLFVVVLPDDNFTASEIDVMSNFISSGGDIFFLGENTSLYSANSRINNALNYLGSNMRIASGLFDSGWYTATGTQITSDIYTAGVSTFSYAAPSPILLLSGGTTLFYGTEGQPFVAYESFGTPVPLPGAVLLGLIGLCYSGWKLRRKPD